MRIHLQLGIALFLASVCYAGWISPTSTNAAAEWTNRTNAIDENASSYASCRTDVGWDTPLEMYLPSSIDYVNKVKVKADFVVGWSPECRIELRVSSVWTQVYQGTIANAAWDEKSHTSYNNVDAVRFQWRFTVNNWGWWLYEIYVWEGSPPALPECTTNDATSVASTSANLHGEVDVDGGETCEYRFEYGLTTSYGSATSWGGSKMAGESFASTITGLTNGQTYHFRAQAKNSVGVGSGADKYFSTGAVSSGWVSPTGYSDASGRWIDEPNAHDDATSSHTYHYHDLGETNWSNFLILTLPSTITSNSIRYYARNDGVYTDQIDVDVSNGGASWTNVYQGAFANLTWETKNFTQATIDRARVRFRVNNTGCTLNWELYEFDYYKVSTNTPTLAWTGETNYTTDGLDPETGYPDTDFEYRVLYDDNDNDGPSSIQVWVDRNGDTDYLDTNEKMNMSVASDAVAAYKDGDYTNGEVFTKTINLPSGISYRYRFYANDGLNDATGTPTTSVTSKPVVSDYPSQVSPNWSKTGLGDVLGIAITESDVYVGLGGTVDDIRKYRLSDGNQRWTYGTSSDCNMPTYMYTGSTYKIAYTYGNFVHAYQDDGGSASPLFSAVNLGSVAGNSYISPDDTTLYVAYTNNITKIRLSTGTVASGFPQTITNISKTADPVAFNDEMYCATTDGSVYKVDSDGTPISSFSGLGGAAVNTPLLVRSDTLYVAPDDPAVYAVRTSDMTAVAGFSLTAGGANKGAMYCDATNLYLAAGTKVEKYSRAGGAALWSTDLGGNISGGPIEHNGYVYVGRDNNNCYALNSSTGAIITNWPYYSMAGNSSAAPVIDKNGQVVFGCDGGDLRAFDLE